MHIEYKVEPALVGRLTGAGILVGRARGSGRATDSGMLLQSHCIKKFYIKSGHSVHTLNTENHQNPLLPLLPPGAMIGLHSNRSPRNGHLPEPGVNNRHM